MSEMSIELSGGELTEAEMATLLETGVVCDEDAEQAAGQAAGTPDVELVNPVTGCIINVDDIDSLILGCDECKTLMAELREFDRTLREIAWSKTEGTTKTRRLRGRKYQAKVVQGDRYPVGAILKEAWNSYPQFRDQYLRIDSVKPQMREVAKLKNLKTDDAAFAQFAGMILRAMEDGTEGLPSVSLEGGEG